MKKRQRGRPKLAVKRVQVVLRLDEDLARWYSGVAEREGRSRNLLMRQVLARVRSMHDRALAVEASGGDYEDVAAVMSEEVLRSMLDIGLVTKWTGVALQSVSADRVRNDQMNRQMLEGR